MSATIDTTEHVCPRMPLDRIELWTTDEDPRWFIGDKYGATREQIYYCPFCGRKL